ncbi:lactonase family protein [Fundicoccus sp. Sow4_D5]|uniref:lactonase family protein n=1 Tax=Fundicoccus sp. Sow4_D5 TaxID=3438782 RepID=UPI003F9329C8
MIQNYILGGYTKRKNKGIHSIEFNPETGTFGSSSLISELDGPTFVALSEDKDLLCAIHKQDNKGGIVAYRLSQDGQWNEIARSFGSDIPGCHVSFRETSRTIYVSNYHGGTVDVYQLDDNDTLSHVQVVQHEGSSVHKNQQSSHVHFADMNADQTLLYVCDLGTDIISTYSIDDVGQLSLASELKLTPGTGPRHLVFHPAKPLVYAIGELNSTTIVLEVAKDGSLSEIQTVTNIPNDQIEESAGAAIRITKDGKFLYTSTRFHNVLTAYSIASEDGTLEKVQEIDTVGQIPRDFILDMTDQFVLVAHQDSDYITVFSRNTETGELKFVNNETFAPECVCIASA